MSDQVITPDLVSSVMRFLASKGGSRSNSRKGFGSSGLASSAGRKGALIRWERDRKLRLSGKKL